MKSKFHQDVERSFAKLVAKHGFRVLTGGYKAEDFGDALVILESDFYSIRLVRDRGQVYVELASPEDPGNWYGFGRVLAAISEKPNDDETWNRSVDLHEAASLIDEHHEGLSKGLGSRRYAHTRAALDRLGQIAKKRLLGRSRRPSSE